MKLANAPTDDTTQTPPSNARRAAPAPPVLRTLDQIFGIFNNGEYLPEILAKFSELQTAMLEHKEQFPSLKAKASITIQVSLEMTAHQDVSMTSNCEIKRPKGPPSMAVAYVTDQGELTLYSPMLRQMHGGVRDAFDPTTGEIR